ncbi:L,D-transpeptidase [Oceaniglobus ichthyenteri]|uniref:L,D-transpeptidase n=1 Tax=Oceaniglobus ichthyenteri TaxID=2136177 RepID=UPI000D39C1CB|nr:L,D-transpeptidase [Oceaniglobus ichthyenteri]
MSLLKPTRRALLASGAAMLATPSVLLAQDSMPALRADSNARRNVSSFKTQRWQDHFETLDRVTIVADTGSRALHYWSADGSDYRMYPTSVPLTDELTRLGYTEVVRKKVGPTWTPTSSMRERDPSLPTFMPAGEDNPLGTHAIYLSWPAYLIHGTHDTRKIGRRSSSGCIGLYNRQIAELFELVPVGAQVRLI